MFKTITICKKQVETKTTINIDHLSVLEKQRYMRDILRGNMLFINELVIDTTRVHPFICDLGSWST